MTMTRVFIVLSVALATPAVAEPIEPGDVYVIDGDTMPLASWEM
jgi:hypothetical protein